MFTCIYPLTSKSLDLRYADLPLHFTFPNPRTENPELSLSEIIDSDVRFSNNKLTTFRFFHKLTALNTFSSIKYRFPFSPQSLGPPEPLPALLSWTWCVLSSCAPTTFCPYCPARP